jgi:hypothetical protein
MLLKTGACFTNELELPINQTVIAAVFNDCNGDPLTPGAQLAKCSDIPTAAAPQTLTLSGQTLSISGGNSVTLPDQDTDAQQLSISGNVVSLTNGGSVTLPTTAAPVPQTLSISGNTVSLSGGGGSVLVPDNDAQTLSLSGNTLSIAGGNSVTLPAGATPVFATPAEAQAGTSTTLHINPADLVARENIPAQTGVSNDVTTIPAPTASQSPWAVNQLGEVLHYAPGVGWQVVNNRFGAQIVQPAGTIPTPVSAWATAVSLMAPRAGRVVVTGHIVVDSSMFSAVAGGIAVNGVNKTASNSDSVGPIGTPSTFAGSSGTATHNISSVNAAISWTGNVAAGDIIQLQGITVAATGQMRLGNLEYTYIN